MQNLDFFSEIQGDQQENVDEKLPLKEEEQGFMENSETVLLTKPPSLDHGCTVAEVRTDPKEKPRENLTDAEMTSESQLNVMDIKKQNGNAAATCHSRVLCSRYIHLRPICLAVLHTLLSVECRLGSG